MGRSGGTYTLPAGNPVVTGTTITSNWANTTFTDIADALTASIAKDGQTTATADLPMGGFNHTGVDDAALKDQYTSANQLLNGNLLTLGSIAGTDTITAGGVDVTLLAYTAGQVFRFLAAGANTGAVTLNIDGVGAVAIVDPDGNALVANDIPAANYVCYVVKRASDFMLINPRGLDKTVYDPAGIAEQVVGAVSNQTVAGDKTFTGTMAMTSKPMNQAKGSDLASATTVNIGAGTGNFIHITGTTTITAFDTVQAGVERSVVFDGILTLTHNATSLILPTGANITTAADDTAIFRSEGSGNWRCISYERADGTALSGSSADFADGGEAGGANRTLGNTDAFNFALLTNNVEQLQVDGTAANAGIITTPNNSHVARKISSGQSIATSTITLVNWGTAITDVQGEWGSSVANTFTAKSAGKYLVIANMRLTTTFTAAGELYIYVDQTELFNKPTYYQFGNNSNVISGVINLTAGQDIDIRIRQVSGSSHNTAVGVESYLSITKIA